MGRSSARYGCRAGAVRAWERFNEDRPDLSREVWPKRGPNASYFRPVTGLSRHAVRRFTDHPSRYVAPQRGGAPDRKGGVAIPPNKDEDEAAELRRQLEEVRAERDAVTRALAAALGADEDTAKRDAMIGRIVRHLRVIKGGGVILGVLGAVEWLWRHPRQVLAAAAAANAAALGTGALILMPPESERRPGAAPTMTPTPAVTATTGPAREPGPTAGPIATAAPTPTAVAGDDAGDDPLPAPTRSGPAPRPPPGPAADPAPVPSPSPDPNQDCIALEVPGAEVNKVLCPGPVG